jgi:hypothetical protein
MGTGVNGKGMVIRAVNAVIAAKITVIASHTPSLLLS